MSSPTIPAAPEAPDYAAANREGIYTDIETLPIRRQIEQAARLGQKIEYFDPSTNSYRTADFTGMGDVEAAKQAAALVSQTNADVQRQQLALREELGVRNAAQTAKEIEAADPLAYQTRQELTGRLLGDLQGGAERIGPNAAVGDAYGRLRSLAEMAPGTDGRLGALYGETAGLRPELSDMGQLGVLQGVQASAARDAGAAPTLERLQMQAARDPGAARTLEQLRGQSAGSGTAAGARLGSIYDEATRLLDPNVTDPTTAMLNQQLERAAADYALGGKLDENVKRDLLNEVRAGQVARGNFLGDAAAVAEATELGSAMEQRQAQRLKTLTDLQQQAFGQNAALRDQRMAAANNRVGTLAGLTEQEAALGQSLRGEQANLAAGAAAQRSAQRGEQAGYATGAEASRTGQRNSLAQLASQIFSGGQALQTGEYAQQLQRLGALQNIAGQDFQQQQQAYNTGLAAAGQAMQGAQAVAGEERAARSESFGRDQQRLANASAMVLGQPITNQFGSLSGAQQGAVGFNPINYSGTNINPNAGAAGANFAQGNFGTQANMWNTQANIAAQGNPWMGLLGQVVGGAAGGATAALI